MIKKAIILYFILLLLVIVYKPLAFRNKTMEFPCVIIILSIVSYFVIDFFFG